MTAFMLAAHRLLPDEERCPLPPRQITEQAARKAGVSQPREEHQRTFATLVAHFAYGGAAGTLFGLVPARGLLPSVSRGVLFGLAVWAGSYLGLLPALGLLSPATRHTWRRNLLMIAAHVVWGSSLGMALHRMRDDSAC